MSDREREALPPLPESIRFKPSGACTCRGPHGPCEACHENELAWREWMDEPSITPREAMDYARAARAALSAPRHEAPEVRLDGEELDELVGDGSFHLENMDTNVWWMELSNPAGAVSVWLRARGKITVHYERRSPHPVPQTAPAK